MKVLGLHVDVIDLREYSVPDKLKKKLSSYDIIWAMGGNTYILRYEMRRSGFDKIIRELLGSGIVYGGDSAGALVAGQSIAGVETADDPKLAEELILEGLKLVPFVILPHVDSPDFAHVLSIFRETYVGKGIIELKDSEAVIFNQGKKFISESKK